MQLPPNGLKALACAPCRSPSPPLLPAQLPPTRLQRICRSARSLAFLVVLPAGRRELRRRLLRRHQGHLTKTAWVRYARRFWRGKPPLRRVRRLRLVLFSDAAGLEVSAALANQWWFLAIGAQRLRGVGYTGGKSPTATWAWATCSSSSTLVWLHPGHFTQAHTLTLLGWVGISALV